MSSLPLKSALKQVGAWSIVVIFLALLTVIFSFLGTLFCAALGGMMMGATKASKRLSLAFSLLSPGVLMATMRTQKSELAEHQVILLAVLCFSAFWVLYLLSMFLVAYEKKGAGATGASSLPASGTTEKESAVPIVRLAELEGKWCCEVSAAEGHGHKRVLDIRDGAFALSTLDSQGRVCLQARGRLKLEEVAETPALACSNCAELAAGI
jgi:hypothetical protein